jgi:hypothetical protein
MNKVTAVAEPGNLKNGLPSELRESLTMLPPERRAYQRSRPLVLIRTSPGIKTKGLQVADVDLLLNKGLGNFEVKGDCQRGKKSLRQRIEPKCPC